MTRQKQKGLGRGLDALLGADAPVRPVEQESQGAIHALPLAHLDPGRFQPRSRMDESALQELADSIRAHGLMQPIVVRPTGAERWEIIAGERRFRAAALAGLAEVPVVVREVPDEQALAMALIENIQREDLNPLEEAQAIKRLIEEFDYSHERAAEAIGRSRSATSNLLRLLNLVEPVQTMLLAGDLDMGHARALLALEPSQQIMVAHEIVERRLSVRDAERLVQRTLEGAQAAPARRGGSSDPDLRRMQERLADVFAAPVTIHADARGRGRLTIGFGSLEQFQGLIDRLGLSEAD